jgi:hypothetical protein
MITCSNNSVAFDSEDCSNALRACAPPYIAKWLPTITAGEPQEVMERLIEKQPWYSPSVKAKARKRAEAITREQLAEKFAELVEAEIARHKPALSVSFQRTLRLPDDGKVYPLPPSLGAFPLRHVEPYARSVPAEWTRRGGFLMPMYQAEAMWLHFSTTFPFALKVGTGFVNAVNGQPWMTGLNRSPQGYVVLPEQPWLDGYCAGPGIIRQFVAARLGKGYTAEEQICGSNNGGIQLEVFPLKPDRFFHKQLCDQLPRTAEDVMDSLVSLDALAEKRFSIGCSVEMGLGAGGSMKQEIYEDPWEADDWDLTLPQTVWVRLCDARRWHHVTGELPPQEPITAQDYKRAGLPWFDYYRDDMMVIGGSSELAHLNSVFAAAEVNGDDSVPQEESVTIEEVKGIGPHAPTQ